MVAKSLLQNLALPAKDGNYFLRPDRILGAFVLAASEPPVGLLEAATSLDCEREADEATKQRLGGVQQAMAVNAASLRAAHFFLRSCNANPLEPSAVVSSSSSSSGRASDDCDVEMSDIFGRRGSKGRTEEGGFEFESVGVIFGARQGFRSGAGAERGGGRQHGEGALLQSRSFQSPEADKEVDGMTDISSLVVTVEGGSETTNCGSARAGSFSDLKRREERDHDTNRPAFDSMI
jgi:hypothetical protein